MSEHPENLIDGGTYDPQMTQALFAHVRHELRTPINAIIGYSELLMEDLQDLEPESLSFFEDLPKIQSGGRLLLQAINEMFDAEKLEEEAFELDLQRFGDQIADGLRTPLNAIIGYTELMLEDAREHELTSFVSDLENISKASHHLLHQVTNLVDLTTITADQIELVFAAQAPSSMVQSVLNTVSRLDELVLANDWRNGTILVADDNEMNRALLARYLEREGYSVLLAEDGEGVLEQLQEQEVDLLFLDIMMPKKNGLVVLEEMKQAARWRHIPVIVISALGETEHVARCIEMGAEEYLHKPIEPSLLKARTRACLERKHLRDLERVYVGQIEREKQRSEQLLHVLFPPTIVEEYKETQRIKPRRYEEVAVLFCDVVGFTSFCETRRPEEVLLHLQELVDTFEQLALTHGLLKIKTMGDAFMATAGLLHPTETAVLDCAQCGLEMVSQVQQLPAGWDVRVGIHVGSVVAGVVGHRQFSFDVWGDTVNTAARIESAGDPGSVCLSASAWERIAAISIGESKGTLKLKGKGQTEIFRFLGVK